MEAAERAQLLASVNSDLAALAVEAASEADVARANNNGNVWRVISVLLLGRLIRNHGFNLNAPRPYQLGAYANNAGQSLIYASYVIPRMFRLKSPTNCPIFSAESTEWDELASGPNCASKHLKTFAAKAATIEIGRRSLCAIQDSPAAAAKMRQLAKLREVMAKQPP